MRRVKSLPLSFFESISQRSIIGTPDVLACINGAFVGLEFKASWKDRPTPLQQHKLDAISRAGGIALVVNPDTEDSVVSVLEQLTTREK